MPRTKTNSKTTLEIALEGVAGDALAAYVAEGLVGSDFIPQGETNHDIRMSIEARAYVNWMTTDRARDETLLMSPEDTRRVFLNRSHAGSLFQGSVDGVEEPEQLTRFMSILDAHRTEEAKERRISEEASEARAKRNRQRDATGFSRIGESVPNNLLPRGDAWEEPEPAGDVPPPLEG